jgi:hypothetical protein
MQLKPVRLAKPTFNDGYVKQQTGLKEGLEGY